jgi:hypothetical protein
LSGRSDISRSVPQKNVTLDEQPKAQVKVIVTFIKTFRWISGTFSKQPLHG